MTRIFPNMPKATHFGQYSVLYTDALHWNHSNNIKNIIPAS